MKLLSIFYRFFIMFLMIGSLTVFVLINRQDIVQSKTEKRPFVLLGSNPSQQVVLNWETVGIEDSMVYYGKNAMQLNLSMNNAIQTQIHHVTLNNLEADTIYFYEVGSLSPQIKNYSYNGQFITAPSDISTSFEFFAISDTQQMGIGSTWLKSMAQTVSQFTPRFLAIMGDLTQEGREKRNWDDFFENISPLTENIPLVPTIGNHEANLDHENTYPEYMNTYFPLSLDSRQFYYAFNYSMVHFSVLDVQWGTEIDLSAAQMNWISEDLSRNQDKTFRVVMMHCPVRDGGFFGNNELIQSQLFPLLKSNNVSVILNGHDHHYERVLWEGIPLITLGGGGALQDPVTIQPSEADRVAFCPSYSRISCEADQMAIRTFTFYGELIDEVIIPSEGL